MPDFEYIAIDAAGKRVRGSVAAASEAAALSELDARKLTPVSVSAGKGAARRRTRVSSRRMAMTYHQLADLLKAGVPLLRTLRLMAQRRSDANLAAVFAEISEAVSEGDDLGEAMSRRPDVFPPVHVAMVRAGEKGGFLEGVLRRLGDLVKGQAELQGKVIGNLIYPAVLLGFGVIVSGVIFGFFVPMFRPMFEKIPGGPPTITKVVFAVSDAVAKYAPITLAVAVAMVFVVARQLRRPMVARKLTELQTRAPLIGPLTRSLAAARFCRMLGTMLGNGVPMLGAMQIARQAAGNVLMEDAIANASEAVRAGQPLAGPLSESGLFDDDVLEMISVGESANNLGDVLVDIAVTIEQRVDRLLTTLVRLIEPLLLLLIAGVVVLVAVSLILPLTKLGGNF